MDNGALSQGVSTGQNTGDTRILKMGLYKQQWVTELSVKAFRLAKAQAIQGFQGKR